MYNNVSMHTIVSMITDVYVYTISLYYHITIGSAYYWYYYDVCISDDAYYSIMFTTSSIIISP